MKGRDPGSDAHPDGQAGGAVFPGLAQQLGLAVLGHLVHQAGGDHRVPSELLSIHPGSSATISEVSASTHFCLTVTCLLELCYLVRHQRRARLSDEFRARVVSFLR